MTLKLCSDEMKRCVQGSEVELTTAGRPGSCICEIKANTKIRVVRKNALRLFIDPDDNNEESIVKVYHCVQNSK